MLPNITPCSPLSTTRRVTTFHALRVRSDSELLVRQMQGRYKVKSADLKPLHERASKMAQQLGYFAIEHVRRELNRDADALANVALDQAGVPKFDRASSGNTTWQDRARSRFQLKLHRRSAAGGRFSRLELHAGFAPRFINGVLVPNRAARLARRRGSRNRIPQ